MISKYLKACFHIIAQTMARDSVSYWCESREYGRLAQLVERNTVNVDAIGSSPISPVRSSLTEVNNFHSLSNSLIGRAVNCL